MTTTAGPYPHPLGSAERIACLLRLALGLLTFVMAGQFAAALSGVAIAAGATAVGWSALMLGALRSDILPPQVLLGLARWSLWLDIVLAVTIYLVFLSDPEATPVVAVPLVAYRLALRHGSAGVVAGAAVFIGLVAGRIGFTRLTTGDFHIRPPMLLAWALTATLVLVLATEARARASAEGRSTGRRANASAGVPKGLPVGAPVAPVGPSIDPEQLRPLSSTASSQPLAGPWSRSFVESLARPVPDALGLPVSGPGAPFLPVSDPGAVDSSVETTGDPRLDSLAACLAMKLHTPAPVRLTDRELEVLVLVGRGHSYGAVASRLFITPSTVRNHVHNLRTKLDLHDRSELLTLARAVAARSGAGGPAGGGAGRR